MSCEDSHSSDKHLCWGRTSSAHPELGVLVQQKLIGCQQIRDFLLQLLYPTLQLAIFFLKHKEFLWIWAELQSDWRCLNQSTFTIMRTSEFILITEGMKQICRGPVLAEPTHLDIILPGR